MSVSTRKACKCIKEKFAFCPFDLLGYRCKEEEFQCQNGWCIKYRARCDNKRDCLDGSDEDKCSCPQNMFQCSVSGTCLPVEKLCDGYKDCEDGSDEKTDCSKCLSA